ncbi:hypothetical protein [Streptomyces sp. NPDC052042]|uniref:hypothetical protein n=1 Tax=Streptomyces sp. NPDC052042 TaxID=3365683 RepID=UPI0037D3DAF1
MKFVHHIVATTAVLWMAAGAVPVAAPTPTETGRDAAEAAAAGWPLAYETDPATGRSTPLGFVSPDGRVVPLSPGQQGYVADPHTGETTAVKKTQVFSSPAEYVRQPK